MDSQHVAAPGAWPRGHAHRAPWWRCCRGRCPSRWLGRLDVNMEIPVESLSEFLESAQLGFRLALLHACDRGLGAADPFGELTLAEASALTQLSEHKAKVRLIDHVRFPRTQPTQAPRVRRVHHSPNAMVWDRQRQAPTCGGSRDCIGVGGGVAQFGRMSDWA